MKNYPACMELRVGVINYGELSILVICHHFLGPSIQGLVTAIQVNVYIGITLSRLSGEF